MFNIISPLNYVGVVSIILIIGGIIMQFIKSNLFVGLRTIDTLSDYEVWKKSNKIGGLILIILGALFFYLNLTAFLLNWESWFDNINLILILETCILIIITIFLVIFANKLKRRKELYVKIFIVPEYFIYFIIIFSIFTIINGILLIFLPPNSFIGIRIAKTLSNPIIWKKVNTISGIGYTILGLIFSYLFYKVIKIKKEEEKKTKVFLKNLTLFIFFTILWSIISVLIAYI